MQEQEPQVPTTPGVTPEGVVTRVRIRIWSGTTCVWGRLGLAGRWRCAGRWNGNWCRDGNG
jgi:hypothetical protein